MGEATELRIVCSFTIEHVPAQQDQLALDPAAEFLPFAYTVQERLDLEHYLRPHHDDDAHGTLIRWAHQFLHTDQPNSTREVLARMNAHIGQSSNTRRATRKARKHRWPRWRWAAAAAATTRC